MRNPQLNSWMKGNNKKGLLALANLFILISLIFLPACFLRTATDG